MESNNAQSDPPPNTIDAGDWRSLLQPDSRHQNVNKIMETLKKQLPFSGQDGLLDLKKIAVRKEEIIYSAATSQSDYLRKISLKMLTMETKSQNTIAGTNPASSSRNPMEAVPQNMQPQVHNQGQSAPMSLAVNQPQGRQQMLAQNFPRNIASAGIQGSAGSASTLSSVSASIDSASQSGHANSADWQEEVYKKITFMKEKYLPEISELYQKISLKLQKHDSLPQPPKTDQLEKLRIFKTMLDRIITFLQVSKMNVNPAHREKLASYEKQIVNFLNSNRPRKPRQVPPHMQSMLLAQSQNMQAQPHDNHMNPQLQSANIQSPVMMLQNTSTLQHNPMSSLAGEEDEAEQADSSLDSDED
ncbi:hypothetical protein QQ045_014561 [Rhodiola kirilowii]